jgi:predicted PurR-regulated permease PerM
VTAVARRILLQMSTVFPVRLAWYLPAAVTAGLLLHLVAPILAALPVGNRIGLHPEAVIFTLLVFGKLFGILGVPLAFPVSAALLVAQRHRRTHYFDSKLYLS